MAFPVDEAGQPAPVTRPAHQADTGLSGERDAGFTPCGTDQGDASLDRLPLVELGDPNGDPLAGG